MGRTCIMPWQPSSAPSPRQASPTAKAIAGAGIRFEIAMSQYEQKLKQYVDGHSIQAEHRSFEQSCHTVAEAARAVGASPEDFVKNICLIASDGALAVAIVKGEDRVSASRVAAALGVRSACARPGSLLRTRSWPGPATPAAARRRSGTRPPS